MWHDLKSMGGSLLIGLKAVGAGAACSGLVGAGVGIGLVFAALLRAYSTNPRLKNQLFAYAIRSEERRVGKEC